MACANDYLEKSRGERTSRGCRPKRESDTKSAVGAFGQYLFQGKGRHTLLLHRESKRNSHDLRLSALRAGRMRAENAESRA